MSNLRNVNATIVSPLESNGAVPVNIQDQHTNLIDVIFSNQTATTTSSAGVSQGDKTITLTSTTGFVDGVRIVVIGSGGIYFGSQVGAPSGSVITLDTPFGVDFDSGATVNASITNMAVDGSSTTQSFLVGPTGPASVDITRIMGYIQDNSSMDDSLFGAITALTYGVVLRFYDSSESAYTNIWNVKSNGEISLMCFDAIYTSSAPAGSYGLRFRNTFAGQEKHGVTIRMDEGDYLEILIQDNLSTLENFSVMAQGHLVTD